MLKIFYRICDRRNGLTELASISKRQCFLNFIAVFGADDLVIVADNTGQQTIDLLDAHVKCIHRTSLGNSGSFLYALNLALQCKDDCRVYFVEDDYLHLPRSRQCLVEGLLRADYVSLYDHSDHDMPQSPDPLTRWGGETSKLLVTRSSHWKYTNSATMTFASRIATLKADAALFRNFCQTPAPQAGLLFKDLASQGRRLITPIPGCSIHCKDNPAPLFFDNDFPVKNEIDLPTVLCGVSEESVVDAAGMSADNGIVPPTVQGRPAAGVPIKINLGGDAELPGYINLDIRTDVRTGDLVCDRKSLPFQDDSASEILAGNALEDTPSKNLFETLNEWKRVLMPGGILDLRVPDLEKKVRDWLCASDESKMLDIYGICSSRKNSEPAPFFGFNRNSLQLFLKALDFNIIACDSTAKGFPERIHCIAEKKPPTVIDLPAFNVHFINGAQVEIVKSSTDDSYYHVEFIDKNDNSTVHSESIQMNYWIKTNREYFTNYAVRITRNGIPVFHHDLDCNGKRVMICLASKSMGDTLAWMPYCEEFRLKHHCELIVSTPLNKLFQKTYPAITFVKPETKVEKLYARYDVACYDDNYWMHKNHWRSVPLQQIATDFLGLEFKEIRPKIAFTVRKRPLPGKYVTISEHSTFRCKYWNRNNAWQALVDALNDFGYQVMIISKETTQLKRIIDKTNRPLEETINNMYHSELHIGVSSGPSWLAWALNKKVVMISGFSQPYSEFQSDCIRIINKNACHGCYNDTKHAFDRSNWVWCPRGKNFECTTSISFEMVWDAILSVLPPCQDIRAAHPTMQARPRVDRHIPARC